MRSALEQAKAKIGRAHEHVSAFEDQNTRAALEYVAFRLFIASGGDHAKGAHVGFPLCSTPDEWRDASKRMKGIDPSFIPIIQSAQPYNRDDDTARALLDLKVFTNADKHRELADMGVVTGARVEIAFEGVASRLTERGVTVQKLDTVGPFSVQSAELSRWRLLRNGEPVASFAEALGTNDLVTVKYSVSFAISLSNGERIISPLRQIADAVNCIIDDAERAVEDRAARSRTLH